MKTKLALTMALGLAGASATGAFGSTIDVYITGSTAFRANVFTACSNLYVGGVPNNGIFFADAAHGGSSSGAKAASWVMSGTNFIPDLTNLQGSGNTLVVHGLFTGSIQGLKSVEQKQELIFAQPHATTGTTADQYITNSPTIAFSDSASQASPPYVTPAGFNEEDVAVQPFVIAKSVNTQGAVTNISNASYEQFNYGINWGRIPLAAWTGSTNDMQNWVYLIERTQDSGTRRTFTQSMNYSFNANVGVYIYDPATNDFYTPTVTSNTPTGGFPYGVVGPAGNGNANLAWGFGYVGGGDVGAELGINNSNNQAIACLSIADAKTIGGGANWAQVVSYNGFWPTAAGAGIHSNGGTNDYSPIILGFYPLWGFEVLEYSATPAGDQTITELELGTQTTAGTFLGVFNAQSVFNNGNVQIGSIENEIDKTKGGSPGATAIPLADMVNQRQAVGGVLSPPFN